MAETESWHPSMSMQAGADDGHTPTDTPADVLAMRRDVVQMLDSALAQHRFAAASACSADVSAAVPEALPHLLRLDLPADQVPERGQLLHVPQTETTTRVPVFASHSPIVECDGCPAQARKALDGMRPGLADEAVQLLGPPGAEAADPATVLDTWLRSSSDSQLPGCDVVLLHATPLQPRLRPASMALAASHNLLEALLAAIGVCAPLSDQAEYGVRCTAML